jgi:hypothetical protein
VCACSSSVRPSAAYGSDEAAGRGDSTVDSACCRRARPQDGDTWRQNEGNWVMIPVRLSLAAQATGGVDDDLVRELQISMVDRLHQIDETLDRMLSEAQGSWYARPSQILPLIVNGAGSSISGVVEQVLLESLRRNAGAASPGTRAYFSRRSWGSMILSVLHPWRMLDRRTSDRWSRSGDGLNSPVGRSRTGCGTNATEERYPTWRRRGHRHISCSQGLGRTSNMPAAPRSWCHGPFRTAAGPHLRR